MIKTTLRLTLKRIALRCDYTVGHLYVDGVKFCDTLEPTDRKLECGGSKIMGKTAIPRGTYRLTVSNSARFNRRLPLLLNVPHFSGVRIHSGNTAADTQGCILLGLNKERGKVVDSRTHVDRLVKMLDDYRDATILIM